MLDFTPRPQTDFRAVRVEFQITTEDSEWPASSEKKVERDMEAATSMVRDHLRFLGCEEIADTGEFGAIVRKADEDSLIQLLRCSGEPLPAQDVLKDIRLTLTANSMPVHEATDWWGDGVDDSSLERWASGKALDPTKVKRDLECWRQCGGNIRLFARSRRHPNIGRRSTPDWVIPGFAARGVVTLLNGWRGIGKSSLLHEAAFRVAADRPSKWLGIPIAGGMISLYLGAEDPDFQVASRSKRYEALAGPSCLFECSQDHMPDTIEEILELAESLPHLDLFIAEPLAAVIEGDGLQATEARRISKQLRRFAARKNCAIVTSLHLVKGGSNAITAKQVEAASRGSGAWIDDCRLSFSMSMRDDGLIQIGLIKSNLDNEELSFISKEGVHRFFRRDEETHTLVEVNGGKEAASARPSRDVIISKKDGAILDALRTVAAERIAVFRTGAKSLYAMKRPELEGVSRRAVEAAIDRLVASGAVVEDETGLRPANPA